MPIRPATPADVPSVLPMVSMLAELHETWDPAKYGYKSNVAEMYRSWMTTRASDPRSVFLVAERDEKLVAFLVGTVEREIPIYRIDSFGFIHDLWVEPEYRNEGISRQITMLAIEKLREMGGKRIRLDTAAKNEPGRALFGSGGFR